jgi:hypothetical protein
MKKIFLCIAVSFVCFTSLHSQSYYLGISGGLHGDLFIFPNNDGNFKIRTNETKLTGNLNFTVFFNHNLEIATGIGFYNYSCSYQYLWGKGLRTITTHDAWSGLRTLSIPVSLGYNLKLYEKLFLKFNMGFDFDFYVYNAKEAEGIFERGDPSESVIVNSHSVWGDPETRFNLLISNRIALQYFTKHNIGLSLFGAYHAGLIPVWQNTYTYIEIQRPSGTEIIESNFISRGSYWQIGFELGYKFGKEKG